MNGALRQNSARNVWDAQSIGYKCVCGKKRTRPDGPDIRGWPLIIVERGEQQLFMYLCDDYGSEAEIIFDRRSPGDRRRVHQRDPTEEGRRHNRRTLDLSETLLMYGWAVVHPDTGARRG